MTDWQTLFDDVNLEPPASASDLDQLQDDLSRPLSSDEIEEIITHQSNPFRVSDPAHRTWEPIDPTNWKMPDVPLPSDYLQFLAWSNGPWTKKGEREFGFFPASAVRSYLLAYHFPCYAPGAIPLGLDGGGIFAALDTRGGWRQDYPVVAMAAGVLDFGECAVLAPGFVAFCEGTAAIEDVLYPPDPRFAEWWQPVDVILIQRPSSPDSLLKLRRTLELDHSLPSLLALTRDLPARVLSRVPAGKYRALVANLPGDLAACIAIVECQDA